MYRYTLHTGKDAATGQAEATFRVVRDLDPLDESDFNIEKSDNLANILLENIKNITLVATIIGLITLFGAAVACGAVCADCEDPIVGRYRGQETDFT